MAQAIIYRLSAIDQSVARSYIQYCLCFPCNSDEGAKEQIKADLTTSIKRAISYMPILAGNVHLVDVHHEGSFAVNQEYGQQKSSEDVQNRQQLGRVEVHLTLAQLSDFKPIVKVLSADDFPYTYEDLAALDMPGDAFVGDVLTPFPDEPQDGDAAFAVQANFIEGGLIVCLSLHHSVADITGLAAVVQYMSMPEDVLPDIRHTVQSLKDDALEESRLRDRVSGSRGIKADLAQHPEYDMAASQSPAPGPKTSRILTFCPKMLDGIRDMVNERIQSMNEEPGIHISTFECLVALLWKTLIRARWPLGSPPPYERSRVSVPVDMAERLDPPLPEQLYGNSHLLSCVEMPLLELRLPFDVGSIAKAARRIHDGSLTMNDSKARSAIAIINECEDVRMLNRPAVNAGNDILLDDWTSLPSDEEASLGLGLGSPEWARRASPSASTSACVVLPVNKATQAYEVLLQIPESEMAIVTEEDTGLHPFLLA